MVKSLSFWRCLALLLLSPLGNELCLICWSCRGWRRRMSLSFAHVVERLSTCGGVMIRREGIIIILYIVTMYASWMMMIGGQTLYSGQYGLLRPCPSLSRSLCTQLQAQHSPATAQPSQQAAADLTNEICQIFVLVITIATRQLHSMLRSTIIIPTRTWGLCFALLPQLRWNEYVYLFIRRQEGDFVGELLEL